jgi:4-hydroxybenzoate polyprenyltransferase
MEGAKIQEEKQIPLCVDLDYTLLTTDILAEQIVQFIRKNPLNILKILWFLLFGKHNLKAKLNEEIGISPEALPFRKETLDFLTAEKKKGRKLVLITASLFQIGERVNEYLGIFDEVYGTRNNTNLRGKNKAKFLVETFGEKGFDYLGDSWHDIPIWKKANKSFIVSNLPILIRKVAKFKNFGGQIRVPKISLKAIVKQLRAHQWTKNLLVFIPMIMAHSFAQEKLTLALIAFFAFCLIASSVYVLNDIFDLQSDRKHPNKMKRPLASSLITINQSIILVSLPLLLGLFLSFSISSQFLLIAILYILINLLYSLYFKGIYLVDIFLLTFFYSIRIYAGGIATQTPVSKWLLAFSVFFFLSLASLKRYAEVVNLNALSTNIRLDRPYTLSNSILTLLIGVASAFASVLVFILYINSDVVVQFYKNPKFLWLLAFALLYWLLFLWNLANKGKMHYDPIIEALTNKISIAIICFMFIMWLLASIL